MTNWNAYAGELSEYLRQMPRGATLVLILSGGREILVGRIDNRMVATLTDKHCRDERLRLGDADKKALAELGWFDTPPSWGLSISDPSDEQVADIAQRCVGALTDAFRISAPEQISHRCRIGGAGPEGRDLDVSALRLPAAQPAPAQRPVPSIFERYPAQLPGRRQQPPAPQPAYPQPPASGHPQPLPAYYPQQPPVLPAYQQQPYQQYPPVAQQPLGYQQQQPPAPPAYQQQPYQQYPPVAQHPGYPQAGYPQAAPAFQPVTPPVPQPSAAASLDTTGWQRDPGGEAWVERQTGAKIALEIQDHPLTEPYWLDDLDQARRKLATDYGHHGCLIEAHQVWIGQARGMAQLYKLPDPRRPSGLLFGVSLFLAKSTQTVIVKYMVDEGPVSGVREAMAMAQLGAFGPERHPYAPGLQSKLPFNRSDDPALDAQFPDHPLTRARTWVRLLDRRLRLSPAFIALPDFRGTGRNH